MVVEGIGTLCSMESGVQSPLRARSLSPCTNNVKKRNLEAPAAVAAHAFLGEEGAWGKQLRLKPRPFKRDHWLQHGLYMALYGHNTAATGKTTNWHFGFLFKISCRSFKKN
jgi:hypothetical protein